MYEVEAPYKRAFNLDEPGKEAEYKMNVEAYGSKAKANQILANRGYDAITFKNGRGEQIANVFTERPLTDIGAAREPVVSKELSLVPKELQGIQGPKNQRGSAPIINDAAKAVQKAVALCRTRRNAGSVRSRATAHAHILG